MKGSIKQFEKFSKKLAEEGGFLSGGGYRFGGPSAKEQREKFLPRALDILLSAESPEEVQEIFKIINNFGSMHIAGSFIKGLRDENFQYKLRKGKIVADDDNRTTAVMNLISKFCIAKIDYIIRDDKHKDITDLTASYGKLVEKLKKDYPSVNTKNVNQSWKNWNLKSAGVTQFVPHAPFGTRPSLGEEWEILNPVTDVREVKIAISKIVESEVCKDVQKKYLLGRVKNLEKYIVDDINKYFVEDAKDLSCCIETLKEDPLYKKIVKICEDIQVLISSLPQMSSKDVEKSIKKIKKEWDLESNRLVVENYKQIPEFTDERSERLSRNRFLFISSESFTSAGDHLSDSDRDNSSLNLG